MWETWDPKANSSDRLALKENKKLEAQAKDAFLRGDVEAAKRLLAERQCPPGHLLYHCITPQLATEVSFLKWELERNDLAAAALRARNNDWIKPKGMQEVWEGLLAEAFSDAGKAREGLELLSELRSRQPHANPELTAHAYWKLGAAEEAKKFMRLAATEALAEASNNSEKQLPTEIAGVQLAMGDTAGGLDTLRQIQRFDANRIAKIRAPLAGRLAFAGLDEEALQTSGRNSDGSGCTVKYYCWASAAWRL